MIKIIMHGCNGKMGQVISGIVEQDDNAVITAGIDIVDNRASSYPVYTDIEQCDTEADVVIDFSSAAAVDPLMEYCEKRNLPLVLCSTGLSEEQITNIHKLSTKLAVLKSANMSFGVNTVMKLLKNVTKLLADAGYDIEIVEKHHNQKVDAPSGTAIALADVMNEELNNEYEYRYDRSDVREKRKKKEIGISAVRGGTIVGDHDIIFAGTDEVIEISHRAYSKAVFAKGAVEAAKFLAGKPAGLYDMSDVISL
ncbi:MAG: 4-hydroxy-tetrahydrodipicolinate reductase [Lachnospiraceae bacterium]|nr:4-hydroxy-tetrahydrodipicolinate reductase [Lachnospiraceae bacterium]